ncbi:T7SS effector LXG polymorphic toxin [Bacillus sp. A31]|uniref:T7SS effector LXG polymorphic toxin n=1 Tax=Bacillus sp. A31 TaxID=3102787 RepID=UPI0039B3B85B
MKILDAPSLLSAVEQRSKAYHELQEEMKFVKKALKSVSGLGDEFTGKVQIISKLFIMILHYTRTLILILLICKRFRGPNEYVSICFKFSDNYVCI